MNRPPFSCLHHVYAYLQWSPDSVRRKVPSRVMSEVAHNLVLFPFWSVDLSRPWWPLLPVTDASPAYGFGMSVARCDPTVTRAAAAGADAASMVRLTWQDGDPPEVHRDGHIVRLPLGLDDFKTVFSIRAHTIAFWSDGAASR